MSRVFCLLLKENPVAYADWYNKYHEAYGVDPPTFNKWLQDGVVDAHLSTPPGTKRFLDTEEEIDPISDFWTEKAEPPPPTLTGWRKLLKSLSEFFHRN